MKTEFTPEEMYEAYVEEMYRIWGEISDDLVHNREESFELLDRVLEETGFKQRFIENIEDYDFCSPGEALLEELNRLGI